MPIEVKGLHVKKDRQEILQELVHSQAKTNVIAISIHGEEELITTAVSNITDTMSGDKRIQLKEYDLHGYPIERSSLLLSDIAGVIHFNTLYDDPVYVRIRNRKSSMNNNIAA